MDEAGLARRVNAIGDPQKLKNFADALEDENYHSIAREARDKLRRMGWEADGKPVRAAAAAPAVAPAPPPAPAPRAAREPAVKLDRKPADPPRVAQPAVYAKPEMLQKAAADPKANIVSHKHLVGGGVGETHKVKFPDGTAAAWKPTRGTGLETRRYGNPEDGMNSMRPRLNAAIPECERELASYKMSEAMGMGIVPYVQLATADIGSGGPGHMMAWVDGKEACELGRTPERDARNDHPDMHRMAALDFITANTDRHYRNYMKGNDGRYYAIDNGLAFPKNSHNRYLSEPQGYLMGRPILDSVKKEVEKLTPDKITEIMREGGFKEEDINGAIGRRNYLLNERTWGPTDAWARESANPRWFGRPIR